MTTGAEAERVARAGRRLAEALRPRDDVEAFCLEVLCQVVRVEHIEALAEMAERATRRERPR